MNPLESPKRIGLVGTGSVGSGWAAIHLARGHEVIACDPAAGAETRLRAFIEDTWDALQRIGLTTAERVPHDKLTFAGNAGTVAESSDFRTSMPRSRRPRRRRS
jgi:carnitine 3-dehydrogenase